MHIRGTDLLKHLLRVKTMRNKNVWREAMKENPIFRIIHEEACQTKTMRRLSWHQA